MGECTSSELKELKKKQLQTPTQTAANTHSDDLTTCPCSADKWARKKGAEQWEIENQNQ